MKRNIREVVKEALNSQENELAELTKELEGKTGNFEHMNAAKILEDYATDEEDLQILEDVLGLKNIEQELKEPDSQPNEASMSSKPSIPSMVPAPAGMNSSKPGGKQFPKQMMPKMGLLPPMVKRPMNMPINPALAGLPPINPMLMYQYMAQGMTSINPQWLTQGMGIQMKQSGKSKGGDKDNHRNSDRDKQKKRKRRDKKYDRKDDKSSD